jgi:hypothetical protein
MTMHTAPKDGTMVWLLVKSDADDWCPLEDEDASWTIGFNQLDLCGIDEWIFVGWNWEQDSFRNGSGAVVAWELLPKPPKGAQT